MEFKKAKLSDFETAYKYIESLWSYNTYNKEKILEVYKEVISEKNSFAFFITDKGEYKGFCHGDYFNTFWMSGLTCYVSSLIVNEDERRKGYGAMLLNKAKDLAVERGCRAMILDSGIPRVNAHKFYENYGFEKSCYGFELIF